MINRKKVASFVKVEQQVARDTSCYDVVVGLSSMTKVGNIKCLIEDGRYLPC